VAFLVNAGSDLKEIIRITIKSTSGYCPLDLAYEDKMVIAKDSFAYEYKPYLETEEHKIRKWKYSSSDDCFKEWFDLVVTKVKELLPLDPFEICTDIGSIDFILRYDDKTSDKYSYYVPADRLLECRIYKVSWTV